MIVQNQDKFTVFNISQLFWVKVLRQLRDLKLDAFVFAFYSNCTSHGKWTAPHCSPRTLKTTPWILNKQQRAHTVPSFCRRTFSKIRSWHGWTCWTVQPFSSQRCCSHVFRCQWGSWHLKDLQVIFSVGGREKSESSTAVAFGSAATEYTSIYISLMFYQM